MRIRWMQRKRKITVEMVKEYSRKHTISMNQAKQELEKDNTDTHYNIKPGMVSGKKYQQ